MTKTDPEALKGKKVVTIDPETMTGTLTQLTPKARKCIELHRKAMTLASEAEVLLRKAAKGAGPEARVLYAQAAELEQAALEQADPAATRTRGILMVSQAALHLKAGRPEQARAAIEQALLPANSTWLRPAAAKHLREMMAVIKAKKKPSRNMGRNRRK
jgi:hypothetical protein